MWISNSSEKHVPQGDGDLQVEVDRVRRKSSVTQGKSHNTVYLNPAYIAPTETFLDKYANALARNKKWANKFRSTNPDVLAALAKGQQPEILWIGCSDSRVPETTLLDLQPGEVFVHRNIANIVTTGDLSSAAVIEYAVNVLRVKHVVLSGHTGCGGAGAALGNKPIGLIDAWLMPLRNMRYRLHDELEQMEPDQRVARLVRENVLQGVQVLKENPNILRAQIEGRLSVHGLIYDIETGDLEELDTEDNEEETIKMRRAFNIE